MRFFGRLTFVADGAAVVLPMKPVARFERSDNREPAAQFRRAAPDFASLKPGYTDGKSPLEKARVGWMEKHE